jgi:hypothetical protein
MSVKSKHILDYKLEELSKKIIQKHTQSKYFFKLVYRKKIYNKVYTCYEGISSKDSKYISLQEAYEKIANLKKKLENFFFLTLNVYETNTNKLNHFNSIITYIPIIVDNQYLEIYIRYLDDIFDKNKIKNLLGSRLNAIGEGGITIQYKNKKYLFII